MVDAGIVNIIRNEKAEDVRFFAFIFLFENMCNNNSKGLKDLDHFMMKCQKFKKPHAVMP